MTISPRTGRFSAQRRFDYRRLVRVFDSYVGTGSGGARVPHARRRVAHDRARASSSHWLPRGMPIWPTVPSHRPPATPTAG